MASNILNKVLITGGAGYVGSTLIPILLEKGYQVRVADFLMFGGESLLGFLGHPNFELVVGDLRDMKFLKKIVPESDVIIHLAALVGEEACRFDPKITEDINFKVTENLANLGLENKVKRFIFASTCSNYGNTRGAEEVDEEYPLDSTTLYTETKKHSEELLLTPEYKALNPIVLRFAMMFGLSPKFRFNLILNDFAREAVVKKQVSVFSPASWRAFTHVNDAAQIYLRCLETPVEKITGQIFNASSTNMQKAQLLEIVKKHLPETKIETIETKTDARSYKVSTKKLVDVLSFKSQKSIEDGFIEIKEAIEKGVFADPYDAKYDIWYQENFLINGGRGYEKN